MSFKDFLKRFMSDSEQHEKILQDSLEHQKREDMSLFGEQMRRDVEAHQEQIQRDSETVQNNMREFEEYNNRLFQEQHMNDLNSFHNNGFGF